MGENSLAPERNRAVRLPRYYYLGFFDFQDSLQVGKVRARNPVVSPLVVLGILRSSLRYLRELLGLLCFVNRFDYQVSNRGC